MTSESMTWHTSNQRYLMAAVAEVRAALEQQLEKEAPSTASSVSSYQQEGWPHESPPALERLAQLFRLSKFEKNILLLCAGMEFDSSWAQLCAEAQGDAGKPYPTFALALSLFPGSPWAAITPGAALRRTYMIDLGAGNAFTACPLRIDERILNYLTGVQQIDKRLLRLAEAPPPSNELVPSHQTLANHIAASWLQASLPFPVIQLCGEDRVSKRAIASTACAQVRLNLLSLAAELLPTEPSDLMLVKTLWEREWALADTLLLIDCDELEDSAKERSIRQFIETFGGPLVVTSRDRLPQKQRPILSFDVEKPTIQEQEQLWQQALGQQASLLDPTIRELVAQFNLGAPGIRAVHNRAMGQLLDELQARPQPGQDYRQVLETLPQAKIRDRLPSLLWNVCRSQARPRLDDLAQRIDTTADWEDLVLPPKEKQTLQGLTNQVQYRATVYRDWGFADKSKRGLGISALFAGKSGTGKTMAAEVIAKTLNLDLYRIDLSAVVSKYIGETEKNLRRLFDAAEGSGVVLLFDEADALFGKRSEVKDSHDRNANIEVSYLLQRMESYRGLAILTTNLKGSLDQAFLRRIRFIVQFPFPDANQRAEIWRRTLPRQLPTDGLEFKKLGRLNVTGGNIRSIALNAAFLAADDGGVLRMQHFLQAAQAEYLKLERPLTDKEVRGWVPTSLDS